MTSARIRLERTPVQGSTILMRCMALLLSIFLVMTVVAQGFSMVPPSTSSATWWPSSSTFLVTSPHRYHAPSHLVVLFGGVSSSSDPKDTDNSNDSESRPSTTSTATATQDPQPPPPPVIDQEDPDAPAGIVGAEFFGGNKQKEEFYDPVAEAQVSELAEKSTETYHRFFQSLDTDDDNDGAFAETTTGPTPAFDSTLSASIGLSLQRQIQDVLYGKDSHDATTNEAEAAATVMIAASGLPPCNYARNLRWETPFGDGGTSNQDTRNSNPLDQLRASKDFYKKMDVAIVGGRQLAPTRSDTSGSSSSLMVFTVELFWEIAVVWPTFWAPHVLLAGSSTLTVQREDGLIVQQVDRLAMDIDDSSSSSILSVLASQISPRFWDWYHIGMSPAAEQMPRRSLPIGPFADYKVFEMPGRLVTAPTLIETGTRDNRNAQVIPDHAFGCMIKTMGPNREEYVPATPVEVRIGREQDGDRLQLSWSIPMSVEFQARNEVLPLPGENPEAVEETEPKCQYRWEPHRRVATIRYGGNVQDEEVTALRKRLYEQVTKDGWEPKLDKNGRPQFFFWQNDVKACYTDRGLGMCVYEWRPAMSKSNEVGIELEIV